MRSLPDRAMNVVIESDKIAVDRVAIAHSWMKKKPVLCARSQDPIREINPANFLLVPGDWPGTVAIDTNKSADLRGTPATRLARSMDKAGCIHQRCICECGARLAPPERPTTGPLHRQFAVRQCTRDGQLAPLPVAPEAFSLLFRSFTSCR